MRKFVRVEDPDTGHQFDVADSDPRIGDTLTPVDGYQPSRLPRPGKPRVAKNGQTATRKRAASSAATTTQTGAGGRTEKE